MIYTKRGSVPASMCDAGTKLSPLALFQLEEDAVTELMARLRIDGITAMREYGAMWVFVKNTLRVLRRPAWQEEYELRSFVSAHSAARLVIDTELRAPGSGEALARARLELCALDLQSGRIRKAAEVGVAEDMPCETPLPELAFSRFPRAGFTPLESVRVRSTNLDYCSHTNNIEYLRFLLNTYRARDFLEREVRQIEIHYENQTFEDDELQLSRARDGERDHFLLTARGSTAAACMIAWE